jgi:hypothetical protein
MSTSFTASRFPQTGQNRWAVSETYVLLQSGQSPLIPRILFIHIESRVPAPVAEP